MKRIEQIVAIFIAAGLSIPSYWFFWTLAGGGGYEKRVKPVLEEICKIGDDLNIKVSKEDVINHLSTLDDIQTKLWLIKVRGGL